LNKNAIFSVVLIKTDKISTSTFFGIYYLSKDRLKINFLKKENYRKS